MAMLEVFKSNGDDVNLISNMVSLKCEDLFDSPGTFELWCQINENNIATLQEDNIINFGNGLGGVISYVGKQNQVDGTKLLNIKGRMVDGVLDSRIVWGLFKTKDFPEKIVEQLLLTQCITTDDITRKVDMLSVDTVNVQASSNIITKQYTGDNIMSAIWALVQTYGFGFDIKLNYDTTPPQLLARVLYGVNRSENQSENNQVIFSLSNGSVSSSEYIKNLQSVKNTFLIGGQGEGVDRVYATLSLATGLTSYLRKEAFIDARDIKNVDDSGVPLTNEAYLALLVERGKEKAREYAAQITFKVDLSETGQYVYGTDYYKGDIVTVIDEELGVSSDVMVKGMTIEYDENNNVTKKLILGAMQAKLIDTITTVVAAKIPSQINGDLAKIDALPGNEYGFLVKNQDGSWDFSDISFSDEDILNSLLNVDGIDSGLDSDLLDGLHGSEYKRCYVGDVADFNLALTEGEYGVSSGTDIPNAPVTGAIYGKLRVHVSDGGTHNNLDNWIWQIFDDTEGRTFKRFKTNANAWQAWRQFWHTGNFNPANYIPTNASCNKNWNWSGQGGQPNWLWGGNDGTNMYVYNPSNFNVNYANSAGNADTVDGYHHDSFAKIASNPAISATKLFVAGYPNDETWSAPWYGIGFSGRTDYSGSGGRAVQVGGYSGVFMHSASGYFALHENGTIIHINTYGNQVTGRDVYISSAGVFGYSSSSRRNKENIIDVTDAEIDALLSLRVKQFNYKFDERKTPLYGLIAEEVEDVLPLLVDYDEVDAVLVPATVKYKEMHSLMLALVQRQQKEINDLREQIIELKQLIN
jgi:hypothetical protein